MCVARPRMGILRASTSSARRMLASEICNKNAVECGADELT